MGAFAPNVGLYIGQHRVSIAEVRSSFGRTRIVRCAEADIPGEQETGAEWAQAVARAVKEALRTSGIRAKTVAVGLSGLDAIVRYFEMPLLPHKEWADAVRFEVQKYLPFDLKGLAYDYHVAADKHRKQVRVLFVATRKELLADLTAGLRWEPAEDTSLGFEYSFYKYNANDNAESGDYTAHVIWVEASKKF